MKIIDCTLRDGGFTNDFNWSRNFYEDYFKLTNYLNVEYIEIGYWQQKNKSKNIFYNIDFDNCMKFKKLTNKKISIMSDFHYSSKNVRNFPQKKDNLASIIRVTSRLEDINECIEFTNDLKEYTKLKISINFFNFSNYSINDIKKLKSKLKKSNSDFIYLADTHGSLDFDSLNRNKQKAILSLVNKKYNLGLHFHDNIGSAVSNFNYCKAKGVKFFDTTIFGIGRGGGNLKTEQVLKKNLILINKFIIKHLNSLKIKDNIYENITGLNSVSNIYAKHALNNKINIELFDKFCKSLNRKNRDNFNIQIFKKINKNANISNLKSYAV